MCSGLFMNIERAINLPHHSLSPTAPDTWQPLTSYSLIAHPPHLPSHPTSLYAPPPLLLPLCTHILAQDDCLCMKGKPPSYNTSGETKIQSM